MADFEKQKVSDPNPLAPNPFAATLPVSRWGKIREFYRGNKWYVWGITLGVIVIGLLAFFAFRPRQAAPA
jgi:hypothetical protein